MSTIKHKVRKGDRFGKLILLGKMQRKRAGSPNTRVRWRVLCDCGTRIVIPQAYLFRKENPKVHCGCVNRGLPTQFKQEYGIWHMMKRRCHDPNHVSYAQYGGRGIHVCNEWYNSFAAFLHYIGKRPSRGHSIDRKDNNKGYEPGNVKWSTAKEQAANKRPRKKA